MRPAHCPHCEFSYGWDGQFCTHCHTPYPLRAAWYAATSLRWFTNYHEPSVRQLLWFGCGCMRTVLRFLPPAAGDWVEEAEASFPPGPVKEDELAALYHEHRINLDDSLGTPSRPAAGALSALDDAIRGVEDVERSVFRLAQFVADAEGQAAVPEVAAERVVRPAFLDAPRRWSGFRSRPRPLTPAQEAEWERWQEAESRAAKIQHTRNDAISGASAMLCHIYREVVPYPFEPVAFDPAWRTSTAVLLVRGMYKSRDFSPMPILADALQDAGCDVPEILEHCRADKTHLRGCWVCEAVLGVA
jgi:hypothetical protein